jgi:hypothetical protein
MHWLGLLFLAAAGLVSVRWMLARVDSLGRPRPFPVGAVILLLLAVGSLAPWFLRWRLEDRLADAASALIGVEVRVHCQAFGGAFIDAGAELGYVRFGADGVPERATLIKREQCRDLSRYLRSDKQSPPLEQVVAVHTLTHEAMHMSGLTSESETECAAVHHDADMARLLGASAEGADRLATTYWQVHYPRMPDGYRSESCPGPPA